MLEKETNIASGNYEYSFTVKNSNDDNIDKVIQLINMIISEGYGEVILDENLSNLITRLGKSVPIK